MYQSTVALMRRINQVCLLLSPVTIAANNNRSWPEYFPMFSTQYNFHVLCFKTNIMGNICDAEYSRFISVRHGGQQCS